MPARDMDMVEDGRSPVAAGSSASNELHIQPAGFLVQLSLDWIVLRASENVDRFLGQSHVTLIDEPLGRFVQAQALHDLRNLFSRSSGSTGIARAYRVRLTDDRPRFDIAFQVVDGRVLLEAVPSPAHGLGQYFGAVGGLIDGLSDQKGSALLDGATRRVRALTGCDRSVIAWSDPAGERQAESNRGGLASGPSAGLVAGLPPIVADSAAAAVPVFPRKPGDASLGAALLRAAPDAALRQLRDLGIGSVVSVPLRLAGEDRGLIQCHGRSARQPGFELHAAAELFAQTLALRLEIDRLRG